MATAIGVVGILQFLLFRTEQYRQIDNRIEATASALISSDLTEADLHEFEEAEDIIQEVIGGERFNQFIIIRGRSGRELYRSPRAFVLPAEIPTGKKWQTLERDGHLIRVLTVPLAHIPNPRARESIRTDERILQTGLILDEDLLRWREISRHTVVYSVLLLGLVLLATLALSEALLRPLNELAHYLRFLGRSADERRMVQEEAGRPPPIPIKTGNDEFGTLVREAQSLHERIATGLRNTQAWTAQMAHEMKTPLTILQNSLERAKSATDDKSRERAIAEASDEVSHLNALISGFLDWASAENFTSGEDIVEAIHLGPTVQELVEKIDRQDRGRLRLEGDTGVMVFARSGFVKQAVSNLVTNALKYSPAGSPVLVRLNGSELSVVDEGPGLPEEILQHLGRPFNHGAHPKRGFGLGLAWVQTICHKYSWSLRFERSGEAGKEKTIASIRFPDEPPSET